MPELLVISPADVVPTLSGPCLPEKIAYLKPISEQGQEAVNKLPPVQLIVDPVSGETLVYEGNTRCALAAFYDLTLQALRYQLGETVASGKQLDINSLNTTRRQQEYAAELGYTTYQALAKTILP